MRVPEDRWPITRNQIRAGRLLSGLGVRELAEVSRLSSTAISQILSGTTRSPHQQTIHNLLACMQARGVEFAPGGWVRHRDDALHGRGASPITDAREFMIENALGLARRLVRVLSGGETAGSDADAKHSKIDGGESES